VGRDRPTTWKFLNALTVQAQGPLALLNGDATISDLVCTLRSATIMKPPSVPNGHEKRSRIGMIRFPRRCGVCPNIATNLTWWLCGRI
jgi:hypothetical protein